MIWLSACSGDAIDTQRYDELHAMVNELEYASEERFDKLGRHYLQGLDYYFQKRGQRPDSMADYLTVRSMLEVTKNLVEFTKEWRINVVWSTGGRNENGDLMNWHHTVSLVALKPSNEFDYLPEFTKEVSTSTIMALLELSTRKYRYIEQVEDSLINIMSNYEEQSREYTTLVSSMQDFDRTEEKLRIWSVQYFSKDSLTINDRIYPTPNGYLSLPIDTWKSLNQPDLSIAIPLEDTTITFYPNRLSR